MPRLSEVSTPPPLTTSACEAIQQFFIKGPSPRNMDALTDIFPMLRNKSKTPLSHPSLRGIEC